MDYRAGKRRIFDCVTNKGRIIGLAPDRSNVKRHYCELETFHNDRCLAIRYPGYKTTEKKCDYCVYLVDENGEHPVSHVEIMQDLYEKTTRDNYEDMRRYIESVAVYGTGILIPASLYSVSSIGFPFEELTSLMFYIAIQEDINYPDAHYQGRKMCFYRYLEAVYCKVHGNHELHEAIEKAVTRCIPKNWRDVGDLYEVVSGICR